MKDPVWYIIARVSELTGGTGWWRSYLIDRAITYFNEWWLIGTTYTAHWMPMPLPSNPNHSDITNQYIYEGVSGGLVKLILFVAIIVQCFRAIGFSLQTMKEMPFSKRILVWSMGVSLVVHVASYFSVVYFDQMIVFWYLLLAIIAVLPRLNKDFSVRGNLVADSIPEPMHP
jgi:O-antigen ligase